jgi:DNA adenine methylase
MLIRYPGSKDRQAARILRSLDLPKRKLCEPFSGTAAITFACIRAGLVDQVWLNDKDRFVADLWAAVRDYPEQLCDLVSTYEPVAESFYELREQPLSDPLTNAFVTIVLHQISYSGLGRRAGSPIGGRNQTGSYGVGCRWNAVRLCAGIREASGLLNKVHATITSVDWADCPDWTWYVDPPYVVAGASLYREGVSPVSELSDHLFRKAEWWSLSIDDAPVVHDIFSWAHIDYGGQTYLGSGRKKDGPRRTELLITPCSPGLF